VLAHNLLVYRNDQLLTILNRAVYTCIQRNR